MKAADKKTLQALARGKTPAELKALFKLIRAHDDRALLAALKKPKAKSAPKGDPLAREIETMLRPILGPSAEKAELLVEHLSRKLGRDLAIEPKGVADAVRRLRAAKVRDAQIRAGAKTLLQEMAALYSPRETVV